MPPVTFYLLRGLAREIRHWGVFPEILAGAADGCSVIPLEIPGAGVLRREHAPLRVEGYVERIRNHFLTLAAADERAVLVGLSFGGMIAASWLGSYPNDFAAGVLINTSDRGCPVTRRLSRRAMLALLGSVVDGNIDKQERRLAHLICNLADADEVGAQWAAIGRSAPMTSANKLRQLFAAATFTLPSRPGVPTLVVVSEKDRLCDPRCSMRIGSKWQVRLASHPEAGHDLTTDAPHWCAGAIIEWLEGGGAGSDPNMA